MYYKLISGSIYSKHKTILLPVILTKIKELLNFLLQFYLNNTVR